MNIEISEDFEFHEEITDEYDIDCERTKDKGVHSKISETFFSLMYLVEKMRSYFFLFV